jgi:hypothetical protein
MNSRHQQSPGGTLVSVARPNIPAERDQRNDAPNPPLRPFYDSLTPLIRALRDREKLAALADDLGMPSWKDDSPEPLLENAGQVRARTHAAIMRKQRRWELGFPSRAAALAALADLHSSRRLADYAGVIAKGRDRANASDIIRELTAALSMAATARAIAPNFTTGCVYELGIIEASRGAVSLAARDCATSPERRYGPPEIGELIEATRKRERELSEMAAIMVFLSELAPRAHDLIAEDKAAAETAEVAERNRQAYAEEEPQRRREAAERARNEAVAAEAERQRAAKEKLDATRAEIARLITTRQFADAQALGFFQFNQAANAFSTDPTANPATVKALHVFRKADEARFACKW